jgi:predicted ThiF/HesA family dinucleotide-utilizing enzyme
MALTATGLNYMLDQLAAGSKVAYAALFTDDLATVEVTGGSPAYARKAITWAAAAAGVKALNGTMPVFDVPACTVKAVGFYDALTAGTQYGMYNVTDEVFAAQGTYTITAGSITLT